MYRNIHSGIIHKCPKVETTLIAIHRWMSKSYVACPYNGRLLGYKRNDILIHVTSQMKLENIMPRHKVHIYESVCMNVQDGESIKIEVR